MEVYKKEVVCRKCGHKEASSNYKSLSCSTAINALIQEARIERECLNCGYLWPERPLDYSTLEQEI